MAHGLSLGMGLKQTMGLRQTQTITPQQRYLVDMLELPEERLGGYVDELVRGNEALQRTGDGRFGGETSKAFARRPTEEDLPPPEARLSSTPDLMEHLVDQLRLERSTEAERRAAFEIIGNLDGRGILQLDLQEIARDAQCTLQEAEDAQWIVMRLDPPGCGASTPAQYLAFMVQQQWPEDPFFPDLVLHHLEDLKKGRVDRVAKALDMDQEDVREYLRMLSEEVDPWPARGFSESDTDYVRASMEIVRDELSGAWVVKMLDPPKPPIQVDPRFQERLAKMPAGGERDNLIKKWNHAQWIIKALEERHSLVKQVADHAVAEQRDFFDHGEDYLRNLTMEHVAERVGRDTSTVSRAVNGRWFQWEGRTWKLRMLFANRGATEGTSEAALHRAIRELIEAEDKRNPISDDAIATVLKRRGLQGVARRTVAKHRERMGIPSSRDRKAR